jgi:iron-sulfur cluster repair protein YtfE (RIC family)
VHASAATIEQEHAAFRPYLDLIKGAADEIGECTIEHTRAEVAKIHDFLAHSLMPHAVAEGQVLFPVVRRESGEAELGIRMTQCHVQLERLTDELDGMRLQLSSAEPLKRTEREIRRILYSIHTVLTAHLAEAEAEVQPLLDAKLSPDDRSELFAAIERSASELANLYE